MSSNNDQNGMTQEIKLVEDLIPGFKPTEIVDEITWKLSKPEALALLKILSDLSIKDIGGLLLNLKDQTNACLIRGQEGTKHKDNGS